MLEKMIRSILNNYTLSMASLMPQMILNKLYKDVYGLIWFKDHHRRQKEH